jgi:hypothetical protein
MKRKLFSFFKAPITHIKRDGYVEVALCGARPQIVCWGGPATCTCKRCLRTKVAQEWVKSAKHPLARRMIGENLRRLGLKWPK